MRLSQGRGVIRLNKILTPVDFSPNSEKALDYGLRLAQLTRASVLLLHVFELPEFSACLPEASSLQGDYLDIKKIFDAAAAKAKERRASSS
jgi:nucleotide-binding universal stress UspA family protein